MPFTAVSLFSGCGGDTLGLERAGGKVVAFSEINKAAIQTHLANFPESVLLCDPTSKSSDITKVPDEVFAQYKGTDVIFAGFPCFTAGTLVLTHLGYIPIEDVTLDHRLLTHTGVFQDIVNLQRKIYSGLLYDIKLRYHPNVISATKEHPFYVRRRTDVWNNTRRLYERKFGEPQWTIAENLEKDDYFGMAINTSEIVPSFNMNRRINKSSIIPVNITLDKADQWFMMGYFLGDGWIEETLKPDGRGTHKIRFAVNVKDLDTVVSRIRNILPITDKLSDTGLCKKFGCADFAWWTILKQFGKYAHGKIIPEWVHSAPKHLVKEFIAGYQAADGCILSRGDVTSFTTVSPDLAFGLQRLYLKLGHIFTINRTARPPTCVIEGRTVNQRDTYEIRGKTELSGLSSFIEDNYVWFASQYIKTREVFNEPVYNFEVENDNSYCVENTIVHNCQGVSNAGKKKATDPRNQMFRQFVRATKAIEPKFVIGENVTGLLTMKSGLAETDPLLFDLIRTEFKKIGYDLTHMQIEATQMGVPQKRKRILIVGWKTGSAFNPESFWASVSSWGAQQTMPKMRSFVQPSLAEAHPLVGDTIPTGFADYALEGVGEVSGAPHPFVVLKAGQKLLSCSKRVSPVHSEIVDLDKPSKTIICTYDHQPRLLVGLKRGTENFVRVLFPDELKRIQGFPAEFILCGNRKEQVVQVGNAVPPALVEAVARVLFP